MSLESVFSTITSSLPAIKISSWKVKVYEEKKLIVKEDDFIKSVINSAKNVISYAQDLVSDIFQESNPDYKEIADFDSFISLNGNHSSQVVKNAVERGSFRSVNKIKDPDQIIVELAKGGYRSGIESVLSNLKKYERSTALCQIVTPFGVINNLNLVKLEYSFTRDNGSNLLIAKLHFQEIVTNSSNSEKQVKDPGTTNTVSTGHLGAEAR